MRALALPILLSVLAIPAQAGSLEVIGYSGHLGEWELTGMVTESTSGQTREYSGPFTMKHVGLCTQDGPEERAGEIRFRLSSSASRLKATLLVGGVECTYSGRLSDSYNGTMNCPDRQAVPLKLWVK